MKIEGIKKNKSGKYTLKLDNNEKIVTYDDVILKNHLLYNKEIDNEILKTLYQDTYYYDIYNKVIKMISTRLRSVKEVEKYLDKNNIEANDKEKIINKLKEVGLLNDKVYAKAFASDKLYLSNYGPGKIYNELVLQDIDSNIIDEVMSNLNIEDIRKKLTKIIAKKIKANSKHSSYMLKQKLINELHNNGFNTDMIIAIYDELASDDNTILEKEYNKIYNKYSKRLEGYDLERKIKEKLYQKGFDINTINTFLSTRSL